MNATKPAIASLLPVLLCTAVLASENPQATTPADPDQVASGGTLIISRASYEQTINQLEQSQGAYSPELGEAYLGLGTTLQTLDQHEEAITALGKSLQSFRYSYGLQSLQQLPVLQAMVSSSKALEKWEEVDALYHLMYHVASRQLPAGDDTRQDTMLQLGRWKIDAAREGWLSEREYPARNAISLYRTEINHLKSDPDHAGTKLQLATLYLDLASAELMEAKRKFDEPLKEFESNGQSATTPTISCETGRTADGRIVRVCTTTETPNLNYYVGKTNTKNFEIGSHMTIMKDAVKQALTALQDEKDNSSQRKELLSKTNNLIVDYNSFMTMMASTINPQSSRRLSR